jgi:hypothetical protein
MTESSDTRRPATVRVRGALAEGLRRLATLAGAAPVLEDLHLVLTIPKTGTYTLLELVQSLGLLADVRGANHQLGWERPAAAWDLNPRPRAFMVNAAWERGRLNERWRVHRHLRRRAIATGCAPPRRLHVISSTREPVGQGLSGAFFSAREYGVAMDAESALARLVDQRPLEAGLLMGVRWWELDCWFDRNVKASLGIDVFAEPFDQARGWQIYEGEDARLLLIRQESFASLPEAVSAFYGLRVSPTVIPHANAGEDHAYRDSYRDAKRRIRIPASLLDTVYSGRYARHFYSDSELQAFRRRWEEG